ncbi:MAG: hypothetical protein IPG50_09525 [Myxococcales bacterium]|nr:hypothetical protein [Myxococcales bacterium]
MQAGFTFTRFVDDIHVFCASKKEARLALYQMVQVLDLVKLQLNRRKTKIRTATEFHVATVLALADEPINADEGEIIAELDDAAEGYAFVPRRVMTRS